MGNLSVSGFETIAGDNTAAQHVLAGAGLSRKSRGMCVNGLFVRNRVKDRHNRYLTRIDTSRNTTDIFTKNLPEQVFNQHAKGLGVYTLPRGTRSTSLAETVDIIGNNFDSIRKQRKDVVGDNYLSGFTWRLPDKLAEYSIV